MSRKCSALGVYAAVGSHSDRHSTARAPVAQVPVAALVLPGQHLGGVREGSRRAGTRREHPEQRPLGLRLGGQPDARPPAGSTCSQMYPSGSPSLSVADPVSANGVRTGIDRSAGAVTVGLWLAGRRLGAADRPEAAGVDVPDRGRERPAHVLHGRLDHVGEAGR